MKRLVLAFLVVTFITQMILALDLPPAPTNYTWQEIPEIKAALLKPNGWFFKHEEQKDSLSYFITKEDLTQSDQFQTGLNVNVFRNINGSAVERGKTLVDQVASKGHAKAGSQVAGPYQAFDCVTKTKEGKKSFMVKTFALANPKTNTLYLFTFKSPESDWDAGFKVFQQIIQALAIDERI